MGGENPEAESPKHERGTGVTWTRDGVNVWWGGVGVGVGVGVLGWGGATVFNKILE